MIMIIVYFSQSFSRVSAPHSINGNANTGLTNAQVLTPEDYCRVNLFIPIFDHFVTLLTDQFNDHQWLVYNVCSLIASIVEHKSFDDLKDSIGFYEVYSPSSSTIKEFQLYKRK